MRHVQHVIQEGQLCGDGYYTKLCRDWFVTHLNTADTFLTTSCTHALEMAALLFEIKLDKDVLVAQKIEF